MPVTQPGLDVLILPIMFISGALMISRTTLSKLKHGLDMILSIIRNICLLVAIIWALIRTGIRCKPDLEATSLQQAGFLCFSNVRSLRCQTSTSVFAEDEEANCDNYPIKIVHLFIVNVAHLMSEERSIHVRMGCYEAGRAGKTDALDARSGPMPTVSALRPSCIYSIATVSTDQALSVLAS